MDTQTMKNSLNVVRGMAVVAGFLAAGMTMAAPLTVTEYNSLLGQAVSWYKLDYASSGDALPAQIVDSNAGINGTVYNYQSGSQKYTWTSMPRAGYGVDRTGLQLNQFTSVTLGTSGVNNSLYQVSGGMSFFARMKFDDFANAGGQGLDLFSNFRWNGGNAQGFRVNVYTSANPTLDRVVELVWGTGTGYANNDPNQFTTVKPVAGEWTDIFIVLDPTEGATGTLRVYVAPTSNAATPSTLYTTVQNGPAINTRLLAPLTDDYTLARLGSGSHSFNGAMESVAVWDRALTADEVLGIHTYAIPEPSTLALLALGLPFLRRRRS